MNLLGVRIDPIGGFFRSSLDGSLRRSLKGCFGDPFGPLWKSLYNSFGIFLKRNFILNIQNIESELNSLWSDLQ